MKIKITKSEYGLHWFGRLWLIRYVNRMGTVWAELLLLAVITRKILSPNHRQCHRVCCQVPFYIYKRRTCDYWLLYTVAMKHVRTCCLSGTFSRRQSIGAFPLALTKCSAVANTCYVSFIKYRKMDQMRDGFVDGWCGVCVCVLVFGTLAIYQNSWKHMKTRNKLTYC